MLCLFSCKESKDEQIDNLHTELYFRSSEADFQHYRAEFYKYWPVHHNYDYSEIMDSAKLKIMHMELIQKKNPDLFQSSLDTLYGYPKKEALFYAKEGLREMDSLMKTD